MLRETRSGDARLGQRPVPSLNRTVQALRGIRGQASRIEPEMRIIALRGGRQLA
jgi:hypothetical protein